MQFSLVSAGDVEWSKHLCPSLLNQQESCGKPGRAFCVKEKIDISANDNAAPYDSTHWYEAKRIAMILDGIKMNMD